MACECPTKLFYAAKEEYKDQGSNDPFLEALRDGGFQVGELARQYYGQGTLIDAPNNALALQQTAKEMKKPQALIFEAAFLHENLFIRADIVQKTGNCIRLIEVKSKSISPHDPRDSLLTQKGLPKSQWKLTLQDIAFQTYVLTQAYPGLEVRPFLMLVDKEKSAVVDAMNSFFFLKKRKGEKSPEVVLSKPLPRVMIQKNNWILCEICVLDAVDLLHKNNYSAKTFAQRIKDWSDHYARDKKIVPTLSSECRDCQFRATADEIKMGKKSGYHECWRAVTGLPDEKLDRGTVLEIWNYTKKDELLATGIYHQTQVNPEIFTGAKALRQRQQVFCVQNNITTPQVDLPGLTTDLSRLKYPLHFIDFETIRAAIPFHRDSAPYEQVAFQFSHHIVSKDGHIRHEGQWINLQRNYWPNKDFLEDLCNQLSQDGGTILHYAHHEQQVLGDLADQVETRGDSRLAMWVRNLMDPSKGDHGQGKGRMVDLQKILVQRYYHPLAGGSNSLKKILPAILNPEGSLHKKYRRPVYGSEMMPSLNLTKGKVWVTATSWDPYEFLPRVSSDIPHVTEKNYNVAGVDEKIDQGGAAMTAYAKVQFTQCRKKEVDDIRKALLQYCELDTLAMVMLWEEWQEQMKSSRTIR